LFLILVKLIVLSNHEPGKFSLLQISWLRSFQFKLILTLAAALSIVSCTAQNSATPQSSSALRPVSSEKTPGSVSAPVFADGDEFEIRLPSTAAKALQLPEDLVMVAKHEENLTMFASAGSPQAEDGVFTIWFDPGFCIVHIRATVFESRMRPCDQTARFPLAVGKTWTAPFELTQLGSVGPRKVAISSPLLER
jgi:hypothetical protein